ncbi:histone-fold-containing protein [Ascobolus immersus RN42]|uniref:DNA polymerase epsilon subunit D n=1 Tax=Ascobolus immersus RN42 TaxID=1160509 RepID=A0A3N4IHV7_ASCIM|nr:histone-fold-containing protein [Ascobolus immersus RN42]
MPRKSPNPTSVPSQEGGTLISLEQNLLPKSIITRLAKSAIPEGSMVQKDAQLALAKSSTVFVNRLIDEANEKARLAGKKTIMPKDVFDALKEMELEEFVPVLENALDKFNARAALKRSASNANGTTDPAAPTVPTASTEAADDDSEERPSKKIRTISGTEIPQAGVPEQTISTDAADELNDSELDTGDELEEDGEDVLEEDEEERHIINAARELPEVEGDLEEQEDGEGEEGDEALDNGEDSD